MSSAAKFAAQSSGYEISNYTHLFDVVQMFGTDFDSVFHFPVIGIDNSELFLPASRRGSFWMSRGVDKGHFRSHPSMAATMSGEKLHERRWTLSQRELSEAGLGSEMKIGAELTCP